MQKPLAISQGFIGGFPMFTLSATCLAIALADKNGHLVMTEKADRFGGTYISICDKHGLIEVQATWAEANARLAALRNRAAR